MPLLRDLLLILIIVVLILSVIVGLFVLVFKICNEGNRKFREKILRDGIRLSDAEYIKRMPFVRAANDIELALKFRTAFAEVAKLPRECIPPEMTIDELFRAQNFILYDGVDLAGLVMTLEDELNAEIPEDSAGIPVTDDDTVAELTRNLLEYAHSHWEAD